MSQNEINNINEKENNDKTSNIIKDINSIVIKNLEESTIKSITEETNFTKNDEEIKNNSPPFPQSIGKSIDNESINKINKENIINKYENNYNNIKENNINQGSHEIDNNNININSDNQQNSNINQKQNSFQQESQGYILNSAQNDINITNNNSKNPHKDEAISPNEKKAQSPFSENLNSSQKSSSKKRNSYHKKSGQNAWKNLAFRFPIQKSLGKVEIPFAFQQNFKDSNDDSRFHSYITLKGIPRLFIDVSDDDKKDKFKLASEIDSLKNTNNEKENKLKAIDANIMNYKSDNDLLREEIEKTKNDINARNNDINKLKASLQQLNQGYNKYDMEINLKLKEKNNSYMRLKEMYDNIKSELANKNLDENKKKEFLLKIKEETNKIQKEYQNNFKYYSNKLMNHSVYPEEYIKQCLQKDLIDFNNYIGARIQKISPKVKELINYIQNAVDNSIGKDYEVKLYGSHATGLCLPWSDIDVVLCKKNGEDIDSNFYITLHDLYQYLKDKNDFQDIKHIGTTTVPLIKIKTKENLGIQSVDISLQDKSHYGIKCVSLVLRFKEEYEVFLPMILALKNILKQANLNDPYKVSNKYFIIYIIISIYIK